MERRRMPDREASQSTLASLQELDPSPIDSPISERSEEYFPSPKSPDTPPTSIRSRTSTLGLSGGHGTVFYLTRIQRYSSYAFSAFLLAHITNVSILPAATQSVTAAESYLLLTRPYYQSPLAEPFVVVLPLLAHISSGLILRLYRRRQLVKRFGAETLDERRKLPWPALSRISLLGYALVPMVFGHSFLNRMLPLYLEGGSSGVGLAYVAHGFAKHRFVSFAGFSALVATASWHVVWGIAKWQEWTPDFAFKSSGSKQRSRKVRWWSINAAAVALTGLWMLGGFGVVGVGGKSEGWVGRGFDEIYNAIPIVGHWM